MKKSLQIKSDSPTPKYQQLIEEIIEKIKNGVLKKGSQLPTINEVTKNLGLARMTVIKAYEELRARGIVEAIHGKGYYVVTNEVKSSMNIFVLFDAMNAYKEVLFNSLRESLGEHVSVNLFFHYHDIRVFENIIVNNLGNYNFYIVMPHFNEDVSEIIRQIPKEKLLILDIDVEQLGNDYTVLYQNFENNIYNGLVAALGLVKKYEGLSMFLSKNRFQYTPKGIVAGFNRFCADYNIQGQIIDNLDDSYLKKGYAYFLFLESDVIRFINWVNAKGLVLGKDIGLLSYDDTPIKEILAGGGITVISNDFAYMGTLAGELTHSREKGKVASPSSLIVRGSL